ncbi:MAG: hypothetical protein U0637_10065 [Phycisphaerales bacterium]
MTWPVFLLALYVVGPKFCEILRDSGAALPGTTRAMCSLAQWVHGDLPGQFVPGVYPLGVVGLVVGAALLAGAAFRTTRAAASVAALVLALAGLVCNAAFIICMMTPLQAMIHQLQGAG